MGVDPVSMLTGGLVDSSGNIGGGVLTGGLPGIGGGSGALPGMGGLLGGTGGSGGGLSIGLPNLPGLGTGLPGLGGTGGAGGLGLPGLGGGTGILGGFGQMIGGAGGGNTPVPQMYMPTSTFKQGTYNFGAQAPTPNAPVNKPPGVNSLFQQPRQVPQGQATPSVNMLMPEYNSAIKFR